MKVSIAGKTKIIGFHVVMLFISIFIILFVMIMQGVLNIYSPYYDNMIATFVLIYSVLLVYQYRKNVGLALLFLIILYANWSIVVGVYYCPSIRPQNLYSQFQDPEIFTRGIVALLFFQITMYVSSLFFEIDNSSIDNVWNTFKPQKLFKFGFAFIYIFIFFSEYALHSGARAGSSALEEYKVLFLIFGCLYSDRKSKFDAALWTTLVGLSTIITFFTGNRVVVLNSVVVLFLFWYQQYFNIKKIVIFSVPVVIVMTIVGMTRGNYSNYGGLNLVWNRLINEGFVTDTFPYAYIPSLATEALIDVIGNKAEILWKNIEYIFLGGDRGYWILSWVTSKYYTNCGGYIAPTYFDLWFGWFGGILTGALTSIMIYVSSVKKNRKKVSSILSIVVIAFVFRWYAYNYLLLFRASLFLAVGYFIMKIINSSIRH